MGAAKKTHYPPYPGAKWDYAVRYSAAMQLQKPNKVICIFCREQAPSSAALTHKADCPARNDDD